MTFLISVLGAVIGIGLLIFVHELGHYLAARAAGVKVEVFSLGFGPKLWGFVRGGTDYRIAVVPLGGYVKVAGEDPLERRNLRPEDLHSKSHLARAVFFAGGIVMNVLFALIAFPIVFGNGVKFTAPVIGAVQSGGPAWTAGLQKGDRILRIAGKTMYSYESMFVELALAGGRGPVEIEFERDGTAHKVELTPVYSASDGLYVAGIEAPIAPGPASIRGVRPDGPGSRAGIRDGDTLLAIDGVPLDADQLAERLATVQPGDRLAVRIRRADTEQDLELEIGSRPFDRPQLGLYSAHTKVSALREVEAVRTLGIALGDRVLAVAGQPFAGRGLSTADVGEDPIRVLVLRDGRELELSASLPASQRARLDAAVALGPMADTVVVSPRAGSPCARAGIVDGDVVRRADGREIHTWDELLAIVRAARELPLVLTIESRAPGGAPATRDVTVAAERQDVADLGFAPDLEPFREVVRADGFSDAVKRGVVASIDMTKQVYVTLKRMLTGDVSARNVSGIVGISVVTYQHAQRGWTELLYLLAALSVNLAVVNLLPIPMLDGGHLLFLLIERVRGTPVSARVLNYSQILGLVFVLALVVFVTFNDIRRLFFS